jgi:hypothetical protein
MKQKPELILLSHYAGYSIIINGKVSPATLNDRGEKLAFVNINLIFLRDNPQFPIDVPNGLSRAVGGGDISENMCETPISKVNIREPIFDVAVMNCGN